MRAVVDAKEFSLALDKVCRLLCKSKLPTLSEVHIRFSNGRCILTSTDSYAWLRLDIPAQGDEFDFLLRRTKDIANACRQFSGELTMDWERSADERKSYSHLRMCCGHRSGEFDTLCSRDYPEWPAVEAEHTFTVNAAAFANRVERVKYATERASSDEMTMNTCIQFDGNRVFALDGFRAAWNTDETQSVPEPFLVPAAQLEHLKLFGDQEVAVGLGSKYVSVTGGTAILLLRKLSIPPFRLDDAIPRQFREEFYVSPKEFLSELKYLKKSAPANRKYTVRLKNGSLLIEVDGCRYRSEIQVDGANDMEIGFNLLYLEDAFQQFKTEDRVKMKLCGPISPAVIEADGRTDCAMVLPVRPSAYARAA